MPHSFATVQSINDLRSAVRDARQNGRTIGCVPTMGALHDGHLSLVEAARRETDFVVVTIFVNPTQFGPSEDLAKYPRPLEADLAKCRAAGVDLVFNPEVETVYPTANATFVEVPGLSEVLEGAHRPGHFRGVTTIVLKLFNMVLPDVAFFGQKDYQQQLLIRHLVADLNVPVRIRTCPTVREPDGLAMSSRNAYLSTEGRQTALALSQALKIAEQSLCDDGQSPAEARARMIEHLTATPGLTLDYATIADSHSLEDLDEATSEMVALIAARVGTTRLIDNQPIGLSS
ncbi:pantoate--beta-alanine ligase [bacterium]|nr:pantoate--beta-alanine ligase [bacterium]